VEASGICTVSIVDGDPANIKVTHPIDIGIASLILSVQY
jgi:2-C-methyl-D-erythritol 4-phosphate cytidylyltransferase